MRDEDYKQARLPFVIKTVKSPSLVFLSHGTPTVYPTFLWVPLHDPPKAMGKGGARKTDMNIKLMLPAGL